MFEFRTIADAIPASQLYLYYFLVFILYLIFLRSLRPTALTLLILVLFNQGLFGSLIEEYGYIVFKVVILLTTAYLFARSKPIGSTRDYRVLILAFTLFSALYWLGVVLNELHLLMGLEKYVDYFVPFALFMSLRKKRITNEDFGYYSNLVIRLLWLQIAFSVIKLVMFGIRENIVGSIANRGGGVAVSYAITASLLYWALNGSKINLKHMLFYVLILLLPIASGKRAFWFIYPIVLLSTVASHRKILNITQYISLMVSIPVIVYFGFRINPSLNPEKKVWGSFSPTYTLTYAMEYSGLSEDSSDVGYAQGRIGASQAIVSKTTEDPLDRDSLIGVRYSQPRQMSDIISDEYAIGRGTLISYFGMNTLFYGWPAAVLLTFIYVYIAFTLKNRKLVIPFAVFVLWDHLFYSGVSVSMFYMISIWLINNSSRSKAGIYDDNRIHQF